MSIWTELGFRTNPFSQYPLDQTLQQRRLLIGRESELAELSRRLNDDRLCLCIEGANGVGKTSLAQAAVFDAGQRENFHYLAISDPYQIATNNATSFIDAVLDDVAALLISIGSSRGEVAAFASSEIAELTVLYDRSPNALTTSRKRQVVRRALTALERREEIGGIVGIIDNLEVGDVSLLLNVLEVARDEVLSLPLMRWLLLGTPGAVRAISSSPRLQGHVTAPIVVPELEPSSVQEVVTRRYEAFALPDAIYPIDTESFQWLYTSLGADLRSALSAVSDFTSKVGSELLRQSPLRERRALLERWLKSEGRRIFDELQGTILVAGWELVSVLGVLPGPVNPFSIGWSLSKRNQEALFCLKQLEGQGIIVQVSDAQRPDELLVQLSKSGYLVYLHRADG